jgi:hypothetical protein
MSRRGEEWKSNQATLAVAAAPSSLLPNRRRELVDGAERVIIRRSRCATARPWPVSDRCTRATAVAMH